MATAPVGGLRRRAGGLGGDRRDLRGFSPQTDRAEAQSTAQAAEDLKHGQALFNQNCASCHGLNAEGTKDAKGNWIAPSLIGVGAASVDFQVSTGRMPAMNPGAQVPRKEPIPAFDTSIKTDYEDKAEREAAEKQKAQAEKNLADLRAYIASLGGGPRCRPRPRSTRPRATWRSAGSCSAPTARSATASPARAAR